MMTICSSRPKLLFTCLLVLLLSSGLAFAQVTVGCPGGTPGAFTSLQQAISSSPDHSSFLVSGTCTENIVIQDRNNLSFFGNPSATIQAADPTIEVMILTGTKRITFTNNLVFKGGQGLVVTQSTNILLQSVSVQNSGSFGITSGNSAITLLQSSVTGSTRSGIVITGGTVSLGGGNSISNNGRIGISAATAHLTMNDGSGPNFISHNGVAGVQLFGTAQGDFNGDYEITNNGGQFGLVVFNNSSVSLSGGIINSNTGVGVHCDGTTHCEFSGVSVDSNGAGGVEIVNHSDASLDGAVDVSGNTGTGILVDQSSSMASSGGNTITANTGDGVILNFLSALSFAANDTITATSGNLALNCNNGSLVRGDVSTYKPKRCGPAFQTVPIH
jgi:hypothetical protein